MPILHSFISYRIVLQSKEKLKKMGRPRKTKHTPVETDGEDVIIDSADSKVNKSLKLVAEQLTSLTRVITHQRKFNINKYSSIRIETKT